MTEHEENHKQEHSHEIHHETKEHHKEHAHHEKTHKSHSEEDEVVDFGNIKNKIKGFFASDTKKESKKEGKEKSEDINVDWKTTKNFFMTYGTIFLILIPIILTIYLRVQPMYLPATDNWAQNTVHNYYQNQIAQQVNQQYPNLPDQNKKILMNNEFAKFVDQNKAMLDQQVTQTSQGFKDRLMYESGDSKYVYLGDIDSYYWLRDARKFLQNGTMCDETEPANDICYMDTYTAAPEKNPSSLRNSGVTHNSKLYAYVIAYAYKFMKIFSPDITIMQASFYVPLLFALLSVILAFLVGKSISGNLGGLVASIFISVNPVQLSRTLGSDNDPLNIFFPLLIIMFFIFAFKATNMKKRLIYGTLTGISVSFYAMAWMGWWYVFDSIVAALLIYLGYYLLKNIIKDRKIGKVLKTKETKNLATTTLLIIISSAVFVTVLSGFSRFMTAITSPLWFTQSKVAALTNLWPNVLVTVAEFNPASIDTVISQMGGKLVFFLGLMGLLFVMTSKKKVTKKQMYMLSFGALVYIFLSSSGATSLGSITFMALMVLPVAVGMLVMLKSEENVDVKMAILLAIWFVATTYAALKGVRFTLLMVSAFGVAFGITLSSLYGIISRWLSRDLKINDFLTKMVVAILLLLLLIAPVKAGLNTATNYIPSVNDAWYESLTKIKNNSEQTAIINSWWDFGHWFKYIADRRVTLDGSSQGGPPLYWLGKLMTTKDEKQSMGILRMLDCGSNKAFQELDKFVKDTPSTIKILNKIVNYDREKAKSTLLKIGLKDQQVEDVLQYTHCNPPENFFITSEDMVGKSGVWSHFGSWDFNRAEMFAKVKGKSLAEGKDILLQDKYNLTPEQAEQYYFEIQSQDGNNWISPWPSYMSGVQGCQAQEDPNSWLCIQSSGGQQIRFLVNLTRKDVTIVNANKDVKPNSLVIPTPEGTEEIFFKDSAQLGASIVLIPTTNGYSSLLTHPILANSMFTRLFYMEGHGLKYFDKFDDQREVTGGRIIVWKVDWEGKDANKVFARANEVQTDTEPEVTSTEKAIDNTVDEIDELTEINEDIDSSTLDEAEV